MERDERASADAVWRRGLEWIEANRAHFALGASPRDAHDLFPMKALAELARVADVLLRQVALDAATRTRAERLLRFAWDEFGGGDVFAEVLARGPWLVLGTMYAIFEANGYSHAATRERLSLLSGGAPVDARLFPRHLAVAPAAPAPFAGDAAAVLALGLALAGRRMGLPFSWSEERLLPLTGLGRRPDIASLSEPEAYSLTHVAFFVTDFGLDPAALDAASRAYLRERGPLWMEDLLRRADLDLYAELAMALACIGEPLPGEVERVLCDAQDKDGSLPGPSRPRQRTDAEPEPARRRFLERYHTTLAAMLASFAGTVGLARRAA